jgi:hypothetical protein
VKERSVRAVEIDQVAIVAAFMNLAVEAGYLPVRIADQHFILLAAIHSNATDVRNFLVYKIPPAFIDAVESNQICGHRFSAPSPKEDQKSCARKNASSAKTRAKQKAISDSGKDQGMQAIDFRTAGSETLCIV